MKKLYSLFTFILCAFLAAGCSEEEEVKVEKLKILSSDVQFDCWGGSGAIKVDASGQAFTATSSQEWCSVAVSDGEITLTVPQYKGLPARTSLIVITSGNESTRVAVTQMGNIAEPDIFDHQFPLEGGEVTFSVKTLDEITVECDADWLTYSIDGANITFTAPAIPGGNLREYQPSIKCGVNEYRPVLSQTNMLGAYRMLYNMDGNTVEASCVIEATDKPNVFKVIPTGALFNDPFLVHFRDNMLVIKCAQRFATAYFVNGTEIVVWLTAYNNQGYFIRNETVEYVAPLNVTDGKFTWVFQDNETWESGGVIYPVGGLFYAGYNKANEDERLYGWILTDLVLQGI